MANDISLELEVQALLTPGATSTEKLERGIAAALSNIKTPKVELAPNVALKFDGNKSTMRRALKQAADELEKAIVGDFAGIGNVLNAQQKDFLKTVDKGLLTNVRDAYRRLSAALSQPGNANFQTSAFLDTVGKILGEPAEFDKLKADQQREVREYIQFVRQQQAQIQQAVNSLNSLNKQIYTDKGTAFQSPISLPKVSEDLTQLKQYAAQLDKITGTQGVQKRIQEAAQAQRQEEQAEEQRYQDTLKGMAERSKKEVQARKQAEEQRLQAVTSNALIALKKDRETRAAAETSAAQDENARYQSALRSMAERQATEAATQVARRQDMIDTAYRSVMTKRKNDKVEAEGENARYQQWLKAAKDRTDKEVADSKLLEKQRVDGALEALKKERARLQTEAVNAEKTAYQATVAHGNSLIDQVGGLGKVNQIQGGDTLAAKAAITDRIKALQAEQAALRVAGDAGSSTYRNNVQTLTELDAALKNVGKTIKDTTVAQKAFGGETERVGGVVGQFIRYALGYGALYQMLTAVNALTRGLVDLDKQLFSIQAISGATDQQMVQVEGAIKNVAQQTMFSINQIADAAKTLAQSGIQPDDMNAALAATANCAAATESSIETAADLLSTMKTVYAELGDATIANQLTRAINISKTTAADLKTILSLSAQTAHSFNLTSEQYLAAVATLRNAGLKASTVATGLRSGMLQIFSPDTAAVKILKERYQEIGEDLSSDLIKNKFFSFTQEKNPLVSALRELERIGVTGAGKGTLARMFDTETVNAIQTLVKNVRELEATSSKITFGNAALDGSQTQLRSLANSFDNLKGAVLNYADSLTTGAMPKLTKFVNFLTDSVDKLEEMNNRARQLTGSGYGAQAGGAIAGAIAGATLTKGGLGSRVAGAGLGAAAGTAVGTSVGGGGQGGTMELVGDIGTAATALYLLKAVFGKLKGLKSVITGGTVVEAEGAVAATAKMGGMFNTVKGLLKAGGPIALVTYLISIFDDVSEASKTMADARAKLKEKSDATTQLFAKSVQQYESKSDAADAFRPSTAGAPATAGKTAATSEAIKRQADLVNQDMAKFFGKKVEDLGQISAIMQKLGEASNSEAGSSTRNALLQELSDASGMSIEALKKQDTQIAQLAGNYREVSGAANGVVEALSQQYNALSQAQANGQQLENTSKAVVTVMQGYLGSGDQSIRERGMKLLGILPATFGEVSDALTQFNQDVFDEAKKEVSESKDKVVEDAQAMFDNLRIALLTEENPEELRKRIDEVVSAQIRLGKSKEQAALSIQTFIDTLSNQVILAAKNSGATKLEQTNARLLLGNGMSTNQQLALGARLNGDQPLGMIPIAQQQVDQNVAMRTRVESATIKTAEDNAKAFAKAAIDFLQKNPGTAMSAATRAAMDEVQGSLDMGGRLTQGGENGKKVIDSQALDTLRKANAKAEEEARLQAETQRKLSEVLVEDYDTKKQQIEIDKKIAEASRLGQDTSGLLAQKRDIQNKLIDQQIAIENVKLGHETDEVAKREIQNRITNLQLQKAQADADYTTQAADSRRNYAVRMKELQEQELKNKQAQLEYRYGQAIKGGNEDEARSLISQQRAVGQQLIDVEREKLKLQGKTKAEIEAALAEQQRQVNLLQVTNADLETIRTRRKEQLDRMNTSGYVGDEAAVAYQKANGDPESRGVMQQNLGAAIDAKTLERDSLSGELDFAGNAEEVQTLTDRIRTLNLELAQMQSKQDDLSSTFADTFSGAGLERSFGRIKTGLENNVMTAKELGRTLENQVVQGAVDFSSGLAQAIVTGKSLKDTMLQLFATMLQGIAQTIIQQQILNAILMITKALGGAASGASNVSAEGGISSVQASRAAVGASNVQVERRATGGTIGTGQRKPSGMITGPGSGTSDQVAALILDKQKRKMRPLLVSNGESILTAAVTKSLGERTIDEWNQAGTAMMAKGGVIGNGAPKMVPGRRGLDSLTVNSDFTFEGSGGMDEREQRETAYALKKMVDQRVNEIVLDEQRPGGILNKDGSRKF